MQKEIQNQCPRSKVFIRIPDLFSMVKPLNEDGFGPIKKETQLLRNNKYQEAMNHYTLDLSIHALVVGSFRHCVLHTALFGKVYRTIFQERNYDLFSKQGSLCTSKIKLKITQKYFLRIYLQFTCTLYLL